MENVAIILFPEFEKLKKEVEQLRTELSMLYLEYDELRFVICKNIETAYILALGSFEYKAYESECEALRLKRKLELIQAKRNRQEKVDLKFIENLLDKEFAEYLKKLNLQIEKMNEALYRDKCERLTESDAKELKRLYRKVVKCLHPDLNPDTTPAQRELFENAVKAYENGDLRALQIIAEMVTENKIPEKSKDALLELNDEKVRLQKLIETIREDISYVKTQYPYCVKYIVEDAEEIEKRKTELLGIIDYYNEIIQIYSARIEEMLR